MSEDALLADALDYARQFRASLAERPVGARASAAELRASFDIPLSEGGEDARSVLRALAVEGDGGLVATAGPRFFGFVIGGSHPVALAADWLTSRGFPRPSRPSCGRPRPPARRWSSCPRTPRRWTTSSST